MRTRSILLAALLSGMAIPLPISAQVTDPELAALQAQLPGTLINDPTSIDWMVTGEGKTKVLRGADIPGGGAALQVTVGRAAAKPWDVQLSIPLTAALAPGDDTVVAFYARSMTGNPARITVRFQQNSGAYDGFADTPLAIGGDWKLYEVTGKAARAIPAGDGIVSLQLGAQKQTVAIGQAIVVKDASSLLGKPAAAKPAAPTGVVSPPPALAAAGPVINDAAARDWVIYGDAMISQPLDVDLPGGKATRFIVSAKQANPWDTGVSIPIGQAIRKGQALRIAVAARQADPITGDSALGIRVQHNAPPYEGFGDNSVKVGAEWQLIQLKTVADRDIPAGEAVVSLQLGGAAQTLDIGPVWVIDASGGN